jgi:hypothetical protein
VTQIGFGHVVLHVTGYLFPGGETDAVAYMQAFLGRRLRTGDPAAIVLEIQWLSFDPVIDVLNRYVGTRIPKKSVITGRVVKLGSGPYGLEARFDNMPGGVRIPPFFASSITATITRFKFAMGAVRRVRRNIVRVIPVQTLNGPGVQRIKDHVLIPHHLISRPASCPGSGRWPWQLLIGFPDGRESVSGTVRCHQ